MLARNMECIIPPVRSADLSLLLPFVIFLSDSFDVYLFRLINGDLDEGIIKIKTLLITSTNSHEHHVVIREDFIVSHSNE